MNKAPVFCPACAQTGLAMGAHWKCHTLSILHLSIVSLISYCTISIRTRHGYKNCIQSNKSTSNHVFFLWIFLMNRLTNSVLCAVSWTPFVCASKRGRHLLLLAIIAIVCLFLIFDFILWRSREKCTVDMEWEWECEKERAVWNMGQRMEERLNSLEFSINHFHVNANEIFQFRRFGGAQKKRENREQETKNENINRWSGSKNSKTKLHVSMECYYAFVHSNFNLLIAPLFSCDGFGCQVKIWLRKLQPFCHPLPPPPNDNGENEKKVPRMMLRSADITHPNPYIQMQRMCVCNILNI